PAGALRRGLDAGPRRPRRPHPRPPSERRPGVLRGLQAPPRPRAGRPSDAERERGVILVNGAERPAPQNARRLLSDFLRHDLGLTGTHVGCEHGVCGCCTVLLDGAPVRSCLMLAVQAEGYELTTIEGLARNSGPLHPVQQAFHETHGLQCGFCTPGFVMSVVGLLAQHPNPTALQIEEGISGNLCRCTGYASIRRAVVRASELSQQTPSPLRGDGWGKGR